jgi:hypothetical protein
LVATTVDARLCATLGFSCLRPPCATGAHVGGRESPAQRGKTPPRRRPTTPSPRRPARVNP